MSVLDYEPASSDDQTQAQRLKAQMEADALAPLAKGLGDEDDDEVGQQTGLGGLRRSRETARMRAEDAAAVDMKAADEVSALDAEDWKVLAVEARKLLQLSVSVVLRRLGQPDD